MLHISLTKGRRTLITVAVVLGLVGVGVYVLISGIGRKDAEKSAADSSPIIGITTMPPEIPLKFTGSLKLPWEGAKGVAVLEPGFSGLETAFTGADGTIYVVDHTGRRPGARVRWYRDGGLIGEHFAQPGSTLFTTIGDGFGYVVAKGMTSSERAILVGADGSIEGSFTVPLELNSGGLVMSKETLYAIAWAGFVDPDTRETTGRDVLVPVAIKGRQLSDNEAQDGRIDGWRIAGDDVWQLRNVGTPQQDGSMKLRTLLALDKAELTIPNDAIALGVDATRRAWVLLPPYELSQRSVAGWPATKDDSAMLVCVTVEGDVEGAMPVRATDGVAWPDFDLNRTIGFDGERLTIMDRTSAGVVVNTYEVTR